MKLNKLILVGLLILTCCTKESLTLEEFYKYLRKTDSGLRHQANGSGNVIVEVQYLPSVLMVSRSLKIQASNNEIDSLTAYFSKFLYFRVTFSKPAVGKVLINDLESSVVIASDNKKVVPRDIQFYSSAVTVNESSALVVFDKDEVLGDFIISFRIDYQDYSFSFKKRDLKRIPKLSINTKTNEG